MNAVDPAAPRNLSSRIGRFPKTLAIVPSVSVIIPAMNEAANLAMSSRHCRPGWTKLISVDGHSVDDTVAVTRALYPKAKVVEQPGKGKGDALQAGFVRDRRNHRDDRCRRIDRRTGDDQVRRRIGWPGAYFAKGSRFSSSGGSDDITRVRRYGNWLLIFLVNRMSGTRLPTCAMATTHSGLVILT